MYTIAHQPNRPRPSGRHNRKHSWRNRLTIKEERGDLSIRRCSAPGLRRTSLERFVQEQFLSTHGAWVTEFMPELLGLFDYRGEIQAGIGLKKADQGRLFLEQYTREPVEKVILDTLGIRVPRHQIVEVGNLASARPGATRRIIQVLGLYLVARGFTWVTFTATRDVLRSIHLLGLKPQSLSPADPRLLEPTGNDWGRYYNEENAPEVMAGYIPSGLASLNERVFEPAQLREMLLSAISTIENAGKPY